MDPLRTSMTFALGWQSSQANKRVMESLIKCGAFDSFQTPRAQLLAGVEDVMRWATQKASGHSNANQMGLFVNGGADPARPELPQTGEWSDIEKLNKERETLGFLLPAIRWINMSGGCTA